MSEKEDRKTWKFWVLLAISGLFFVWLYFWTQQRHSQGNLARQLLNKQRNVAISNSLFN